MRVTERVRSPRTQLSKVIELGVALLVSLAVCSPFAGFDLLIIAFGALLFLVSSLTRSDRDIARSLRVCVLWWLPFLALCMASAGWSELPEATVRGVVTSAIVLMSAYRAASVLPAAALVRSFATGLRIPLTVSVVQGVLLPGTALVSSEYQSGALQGIFAHRNFLAFAAGMLIVIAMARSPEGKRIPTRWPDIALAAICLVWAQSQTAIVATTVGVLGVVVVRLGRRLDPTARIGLFAVVTATVGGATSAVLGNIAGVTQGLGRDTTLTGRTDVWAAVLEEIPRHPWFGAGWAAVWREGLAVSDRMWSDSGFEMYHAHNGYLDLILQVGIIGAVLFIVPFLSILVGGIVESARLRDHQVPEVVVGGTALLVVTNATESAFVAVSGWACVVVLHLARRRAVAEERCAGNGHA